MQLPRQTCPVGLVLGALAGAAGAVVSLASEIVVDSPWPWWFRPFGHTLGPWLLLTLLVGRLFRDRLAVAACAGLATALALTIGYDLGYDVWFDVASDQPLLSHSYVVLAVLAGPAYGVAGATLRSPRTVLRIAGLVLAGAPWLYTGIGMLQEERGYLLEEPRLVHGGVLSLAIGVALTWVLATASRDWLLSLPLAVVTGCAMAVMLPLVGDSEAVGPPAPEHGPHASTGPDKPLIGRG